MSQEKNIDNEKVNVETTDKAIAAEDVKQSEKRASGAEDIKQGEKKPVKVITADVEEEKSENVITFSKSYDFEGELIETLDMTKIEDLNAIGMRKVDNIYRKLTKNISATPEFTNDYAIAVAHVLTGYPLEFFQKISAKDLIKIRTCVINFLYSEE